MGYTHYWELEEKNEGGEDLINDIKKVLEKYKDIIQYEYDNPKEIEVNKNRIRFNGIGDKGHETFLFDFTKTGFEFCKTARKPYDIPVCKVLIILKHYLKDDLKVSSDGDIEKGEWEEPIEEIVQEFGIEYVKEIQKELEKEDD